MKAFADRIRAMNEMYKLPINDAPTFLADGTRRLEGFKKTLSDEVSEVDEIIECSYGQGSDFKTDLELLVMMADWFADIIVYCRSEALKYGIPLEEVLDIIMDSNESKLGADGKPIYNEDGKFLKGPNYWKPEPKIRDLLKARMSANLKPLSGEPK